jgi:serine-type D-Ala-D-Ala carboxypeptidase/endopeptidase
VSALADLTWDGAGLLTGAVPASAAVVVATVRDGRPEVSCAGRTEFDGGVPVDGDTVFEIGSLTKTFTALLFAELAHRGTVHQHEPIDAFLPAQCRPRGPGGEPITLLHLATHTSGLPRLPPGLVRRALPVWLSNPYAHFSDADLLHGLARTKVRVRPGHRVRYSNFGVALLGRLLAERSGRGYPELLADDVCAPLGLTATGCAPPPDALTAVGHRRGIPMPPWEIPGMPAAGAVRSTGNDLARYLAAHLAAAEEPLAVRPPLTQALRDVARPRLIVPRSGDRLGLVWNLRDSSAGSVAFHSGATRGFTAFIGFAPRAGVALAALTNSGPELNGRFLQGAYGLLKAMAKRA